MYRYYYESVDRDYVVVLELTPEGVEEMGAIYDEVNLDHNEELEYFDFYENYIEGILDRVYETYLHFSEYDIHFDPTVRYHGEFKGEADFISVENFSKEVAQDIADNINQFVPETNLEARVVADTRY